jgi:hypothetical protein
MTIRSFGVLVSLAGATVGAHTALIAWSARIQQRVEERTEVMVTRVVRAELTPIRDDVARAHTRLDQHIAMHIAPTGRP